VHCLPLLAGLMKRLVHSNRQTQAIVSSRSRSFLSFCLAILLVSAGCVERGRPQPASEPAISMQSRQIPSFDMNRAYRDLVRQVTGGPRIPGTTGHRTCLSFLEQQLRANADTFFEQTFYTTHSRLGTIELTNLIAQFRPENAKRILLTAHWDSRPWADSDPVVERRTSPVPGANDGGSGVAVLLEVARAMRESSPAVGVDLVFFDGEDLGKEGNLDSWCLGSKYFTKNPPVKLVYECAVNLDMIGDKNLTIPREQRSDRASHAVVDLVFSCARELGISQFVDHLGEEVYDDHVPLIDAGIRAIDLIDFNYPDESNSYWHTTADTPEHCSAESLGAVGDVLLRLIYIKSLTF
jgi:glutaminyl-peptide cyclotransferase